MPEGDAVWRTARRLHRALAGQPLLGCDLRVPALATSDLSGRHTLEVVPRGKHLLHRLEGGLTLHSHLRMDGSWRVLDVSGTENPGTSRLGSDPRPGSDPPPGSDPSSALRHPATRHHTVRAVLWSTEHLAVGTRLGMLDLVQTRHEDRLVGHLGPDLLDRGFDREVALAHLVRDPSVPVAEALLDQRNLAGIGTIYASEPLFEHRTSPWTPVGEVPQETLAAVVDTARLWMVRSCRLGPGPGARPGRRPEVGEPADGWLPWRYRVFGREGMPCRRCGTTIRQVPLGTQPRERVISHCPSCQARVTV